ncbi:MAG: C40 family peptidase [Bacteroidetes bacterium]|nr:C40 family peptidase [Bacteroidota bacterium]
MDSLIRCNVSWAPLRKEADSRSEMTSAILYGEAATVLEDSGDWLFVETRFDHYRGWVNKLQMKGVENDSRMQVVRESLHLNNGRHQFYLPAGSEIPEGTSLLIGEERYPLPDLNHTPTMSVRSQMLTEARTWIGAPYLWGGRTIWGCDCSGFVQVIAKTHGIALPRDASQQISCGKEVAFEQQHPGDLAFFSNEQGAIIHVGICTGGHSIIHASGAVREDMLDERGIFHEGLNRYSHRLHSIRSII